MKKHLILLITILCINNTVFASFPVVTNTSTIVANDCDIIILESGEEISVNVLEITPDLIKYKKCDREKGPLISISKEDVFMIKYNDGTKEIIKSSKKEKESVSKDNSSYIGWFVAYYLLCGTSIFFSLALLDWITGLLLLVLALPFGIIGYTKKKQAESQ